MNISTIAIKVFVSLFSFGIVPVCCLGFKYFYRQHVFHLAKTTQENVEKLAQKTLNFSFSPPSSSCLGLEEQHQIPECEVPDLVSIGSDEKEKNVIDLRKEIPIISNPFVSSSSCTLSSSVVPDGAKNTEETVQEKKIFNDSSSSSSFSSSASSSSVVYDKRKESNESERLTEKKVNDSEKERQFSQFIRFMNYGITSENIQDRLTELALNKDSINKRFFAFVELLSQADFELLERKQLHFESENLPIVQNFFDALMEEEFYCREITEVTGYSVEFIKQMSERQRTLLLTKDFFNRIFVAFTIRSLDEEINLPEGDRNLDKQKQLILYSSNLPSKKTMEIIREAEIIGNDHKKSAWANFLLKSAVNQKYSLIEAALDEYLKLTSGTNYKDLDRFINSLLYQEKYDTIRFVGGKLNNLEELEIRIQKREAELWAQDERLLIEIQSKFLEGDYKACLIFSTRIRSGLTKERFFKKFFEDVIRKKDLDKVKQVMDAVGEETSLEVKNMILQKISSLDLRSPDEKILCDIIARYPISGELMKFYTSEKFYAALKLARSMTPGSSEQKKAYIHCYDFALRMKNLLGVHFIDFSQEIPSEINQFDYEAQVALFFLQADQKQRACVENPDTLPELESLFEMYYILRDVQERHKFSGNTSLWRGERGDMMNFDRLYENLYNVFRMCQANATNDELFFDHQKSSVLGKRNQRLRK